MLPIAQACPEAVLRPLFLASYKQSKPTCPVANHRWPHVTHGLYTNARPAPWNSAERLRSRTQPIWSGSLATAGHLLKRNLAVAASPQPIEVKQASGAEGVQVVLFGWLGARDKYLEKYAELWKSKGADVFMYTPPITATLFPFQADRSVAQYEREVKAHRESAPPPKAVVYHVFSNGGFLFMGALMRGVAKGLVSQEALGNVSGIIIDSAPGVINADMAARGVGAAALGEGSEGFELRQPTTVRLAQTVFGAYLQMPAIRTRLGEVRQAWEEYCPKCPQLFLYSQKDVLIPSSDIESFMELQANRGVEVAHQKWEDTVHVEHYRKYPTQYASIVERFVQQLKEHSHRKTLR
mmetsp:Transcript_16763/g.36442  ORF Transcript_16763/g.36442 Transcript_16763/m.36442 type:complete len:352 (-) Transcript_16763:324-1379(-)|eukprot:CAMPEP_0118921614 /NCGR_PEP_ID=MMETSP1169-20130426/828_1 /TAXON_ID=36882 /ORGANISM="Pyramimonas obovata, Strain CCMP722" /LENGTH=351 /DNA_ID=CAMNT_0006862365 /DNA_START=153 /DNA_END=1208 /DNA_ORIENTATION=+